MSPMRGTVHHIGEEVSRFVVCDRGSLSEICLQQGLRGAHGAEAHAADREGSAGTGVAGTRGRQQVWPSSVVTSSGVDVPAPRSGVVAQNDARASGRSENTLNCNLPRQTDTVAIPPQSRVGNFSGSQYLLHPSPAADSISRANSVSFLSALLVSFPGRAPPKPSRP